LEVFKAPDFSAFLEHFTSLTHNTTQIQFICLTESKKKKKDNFNMNDKQNTQNKLHFILGALGFYEKTSGGEVLKKWDTTHLKNRSYFVIDYLNCEHEHKGDTPKAGSSSAKDTSQKDVFFELFELSDKETTQHFTRIVFGDFPWSKLNRLVTEGHRKGEITKDELLEWQNIQKYNVNHSEVLAKVTGDRKAEYEKMTRGVLNDILRWAIALDGRWGCEEVNGELLS
jgi:hypothetical protein